MKIKLLVIGKFSKNNGEIIFYGNQCANGYFDERENKNKFFFSKKSSHITKLETM